MIVAFFTILGLVAVCVALAAHGVLSPERAAECLLVLVLMLAIGRAMGTGLIGSIVRVGIPVVSVLAVAQYFSFGDHAAAVEIAAQLVAIGLLLFGIFVMVAGPFRR